MNPVRYSSTFWRRSIKLWMSWWTMWTINNVVKVIFTIFNYKLTCVHRRLCNTNYAWPWIDVQAANVILTVNLGLSLLLKIHWWTSSNADNYTFCVASAYSLWALHATNTTNNLLLIRSNDYVDLCIKCVNIRNYKHKFVLGAQGRKRLGWHGILAVHVRK